jgi:ATP-binding cassette subfamily B protein
VGSWLYLNGQLSLLLFLAFLVLGLRFYLPIQMLADVNVLLREMEVSIERTSRLLATPPLPVPDKSVKANSFTVEFQNVSFSYGEKPVLKNISFTAPERSITALVGPSGSGKTTIINLIARFWDVESGAVLIGGADIRQMKPETLLSYITMVFQDVYLFHDTILNNIRFGKPSATDTEVIAAAKAARCHEFIERLSEGYHTLVGEGGSTLSGGEKQRLSIARAILKDAPIVLLDEATASLDPENEALIQEAVNVLVATKTLIIIAHRLSTITTADQILVLDEGRLVEQGSHYQLLARKGLYQRFWQERQQAKSWQVRSNSKLKL